MCNFESGPLFFSVCQKVINKPSVKKSQFSLSVSTHCSPSTRNHWCSLRPSAASFLPLAPTKVARTIQKLRMREPLLYPTAKIQIMASLHVQ